MSALILGDVHLGKGENLGQNITGAIINSRIQDQIDLLNWTLSKAVEKNISNIIITGDVFEEPKPAPHLIAAFITWLQLCVNKSISVHILFGNHDFLRIGSVYTSPLDIISASKMKNIHVYNEITTLDINDVSYTFVPFRDRKSFSVASNSEALGLLQSEINNSIQNENITSKNKVLIGHLAIEGSLPVGDEIDDMVNELFCPVTMFGDFDYVWMGHVHTPQVLNKKNPFVAHIGSMDVSNFGETEHKKHIVIIDPDADDFYHTEKLPNRSLKKISITIPTDVEDTTSYVLDLLNKEEKLSDSIVRIDVSLENGSSASINKSDIEALLIKKGAHKVAGVIESKKSKIIKKNAHTTLTSKMDVNLAIIEYAKEAIDKSHKDLFVATAKSIYKEFLASK